MRAVQPDDWEVLEEAKAEVLQLEARVMVGPFFL